MLLPATTDEAPPVEPPPVEPPPVEPPPVEPAQPVAPAAVGLGHVRDAWDATLQELKRRSRRVAAYVTPSHPVRFENDTLVVEVQSEFHKDAMTEEKNRSTLADAIHAALGIRPPVRFVARGAQPEAAPAADEPAAIDDYADATAVDGAEHDPVELIKKGFRAEVVEDRIGP